MRIRAWQWTALDYVLGALTAGFLFAAASPIPQAIAVPPPGVLRYYHLPVGGPLVPGADRAEVLVAGDLGGQQRHVPLQPCP